jgi:hypothetical protein
MAVKAAGTVSIKKALPLGDQLGSGLPPSPQGYAVTKRCKAKACARVSL